MRSNNHLPDDPCFGVPPTRAERSTFARPDGPSRPPMVLGAIGVDDAAELPAAIVDGFACIADGADGLALRFSGDSPLAVADHVDIADQLSAACVMPIFIRASRPMVAGDHQVITPCASAGAGRRSDVLCDLGLDELQASPGSAAVGEAWSRADGIDRFSISTVGFDGLGDGELIALATIACERGATAIVTDHVRTVRRVVDTIVPIMAAKDTSPPLADPESSASITETGTAVDSCP